MKHISFDPLYRRPTSGAAAARIMAIAVAGKGWLGGFNHHGNRQPGWGVRIVNKLVALLYIHISTNMCNCGAAQCARPRLYAGPHVAPFPRFDQLANKD
ncbi:unnamed protein product [Arctia plantaginis]|uniref:Uncharacterized protein n=1 Tax=Arctia plantaginis TaxID=874455 RepID=A0A8S1B8U9_ARCPL|nr:unnamed protein product [Arctia plantaginis]